MSETGAEVERELEGAKREPTRRRSLVFTGSAREYFRLWIVNLCLTLFTLGIFSAWAKVRRKRYFYAHTELAGTPFQYLATPIPILKGRLIAAALLILWYVGFHFSWRLLVGVLALGTVLLPWVLVRTAAFNARYTAYRNITFHFAGTYWGAAGTLLAAVLLSALTCGLGYPWSYALIRRYIVEQTSFGGVSASYRVQGGHLVVPFLVVAGVLALTTSVFVGAMRHRIDSERWLTPWMLLSNAAYALAYAFLSARLARINWRRSSLGPLDFRADYRARDFIWLYLTNILAIVGSLGLLVPWAAVRMHRYRLARLSVLQNGPVDVFAGRTESVIRATGAEIADLFDFDLSL